MADIDEILEDKMHVPHVLDPAETMQIEETLSGLRDQEVAVMLLDACGFKQTEIAGILGISRTSVWNKNARGVISLRERLKP